MASRLEEIRNIRLGKLAKLRELGIDPYPAQSQKDVGNGVVIDNFSKYENKELTLTGRLRSIRAHGKIAFADLEDQSGKIQLLLRQSVIDFPDLSLLDVGDFVEARGTVCKTKTGAISLDVKKLKLLTKSVRPLPDSWEGVKDPEIVFRRRYLDLILNPGSRKLFERKSKFWAVNRQYMLENGFIEVETPVLEHVTGGADAKPFKTHHNALDEDFYLRISTELYLKRLIGGGFERIFTVGPNFRNEGIDDEHLQEFYQIEWYWAYADYRDNMNMVRDMFRYIASNVYGKTKFTRGEHTFDLASDWTEIDYAVSIMDKFGVDIFQDSDEKMAKVLLENKVKLDGGVNRARLVDNLWKIIRKDIAGPAFLINEPVFVSPLAKSKPEDRRLTERFHVILAGSELGNGYSELNDPLDQLERFREQQAARDAGDDESQMMDIDFVEMLEYGMPPTSGYAHSERLFWFLENVTAREGTLFPQTRRHIDPLTRQIYGLEEVNKREKSASASYDYGSHKIVAVVDESLNKGKIANALGHMAFSAGKYLSSEMMGRETLVDADGAKHQGIAKYPFIIVTADKNKIKQIVDQARAEGIHYIDYPEAMFKTGDDNELSEVLSKQSKDKIVYRGILLADRSTVINSLTEGLPLYKD